ncbi:MAG: amino acid adenylation domain-containing protein [Xanthomonadales bacterium]|nr:amino acid adenylation domain-containing protein [Xanthomonadales bacterium]
MSELERRLANLSPEKRAQLMQQLAKRAAETAVPQTEIGRRPRPPRLPLSSAQQRLWILDQFDPGNSVYNVTSLMRLQGTLDVDVLQRCLDAILVRHESLRTVFPKDADGPFQRILPPSPVPMARFDVSDRGDAAACEAEAFALTRADARAPFDLVAGPILRATLVRIDAQDHLLALSAHHIAVDGWSFGVLFGELSKLYRAFLAGEPSPLPELPIQYADYTLWQQDELGSAELARQLEYWRTRFPDRPTVLELPGDRPRPPVQSYRGAMLSRTLPRELYDAVKRFSRQEGTTPFMTFLAAYQALLARYSGQDDIVVGVGNANRTRRELEPLVGFFINTLPLRADLSADPTFRELLAQVKAATLDSYANQDLPIERLIESLDIERDLSHAPLFQTMLFYQNFPSSEVDLPGLRMQAVDMADAHSGTARVDFSIFAAEDDEAGLIMLMEYATDLFDRDYVEAFADHLGQLLRSAIDAPDTRVRALEILAPAERQRLLVEWNATAAPMPAAQTVHALFEAQAARAPDALAVVQGEAALDYATLDAQATRIAAHLRAHGVGPGRMVGLYLERTPRMLAALLGVLKAGAAYVPLDPGFPAERIGYMLEDAAAPVVLTERAIAAQLPAGAHVALDVDALDGDALDGDALDGDVPPAADAVPGDAGAEDPAYVIFTSGSTGRPKGVRIPHRAAVNFLASMAREPGLGADDRLCAITTLSFDIALLELMLPLTVGARVVLADRATAADGAALAALLDASGTTVLQATPATWRMLLDSGWRGRDGLRMLCGGEALPRELADRLLACGAALWNVYGPTETTVWSTLERVTAGDGPVPIGHPIANTEVYVVDKAMRPMPAGLPGELLIGGLGVALDYLDRPELTAEKFVDDPFGPRPGGRLYRTGDLARWRRDGRLEALGRIDHQVKLRGFRIELGEIESVLLQGEAVAQAVVVCREDRPGDKRLVAYLVPASAAADVTALRNRLRERLPDYMLPAAFVGLDRLPLTPNGKVDRRALPAPEADAFGAADETAPRNPEEETLVALWAEILGRPKIGIHDNFFDLGGHSLLATQLVARMQAALGPDITLRMVFEAPTVAGFSELLLRQRLQSLGADDLAGMLGELEGLSDEELQALLAG